MKTTMRAFPGARLPAWENQAEKWQKRDARIIRAIERHAEVRARQAGDLSLRRRAVRAEGAEYYTTPEAMPVPGGWRFSRPIDHPTAAGRRAQRRIQRREHEEAVSAARGCWRRLPRGGGMSFRAGSK